MDKRQVEELETCSCSSGFLCLIRWCIINISELFGLLHFITKTKIIRQVLNILDLKCCWLKKTKLNTQKEEMNFVNLNCRVRKNCWVKKPKHFWFSYLYPHQLLKKIVELPILKKLTWIVIIIQEFCQNVDFFFSDNFLLLLLHLVLFKLLFLLIHLPLHRCLLNYWSYQGMTHNKFLKKQTNKRFKNAKLWT